MKKFRIIVSVTRTPNSEFGLDMVVYRKGNDQAEAAESAVKYLRQEGYIILEIRAVEVVE